MLHDDSSQLFFNQPEIIAVIEEILALLMPQYLDAAHGICFSWLPGGISVQKTAGRKDPAIACMKLLRDSRRVRETSMKEKGTVEFSAVPFPYQVVFYASAMISPVYTFPASTATASPLTVTLPLTAQPSPTAR